MQIQHASTVESTFGWLRRAALIAIVGLGLMLMGSAGARSARADSGRGTTNASIPLLAAISFQAPAPAPGGRCLALTRSFQLSFIVTGFGQVSDNQSHCVDPNGPNPFAFTNGIFTWTNANGDTLYGSYDGFLRPTPTSSADNIYAVYGEFSIEGGTGAFAGASGGGALTGAYNIVSSDTGISLDGVLSLPDTFKP